MLASFFSDYSSPRDTNQDSAHKKAVEEKEKAHAATIEAKAKEHENVIKQKEQAHAAAIKAIKAEHEEARQGPTKPPPRARYWQSRTGLPSPKPR